MILTDARDFTELFARPHLDRVVLRNGAAIAAKPPRHADLDALEGLAP
jgi:cytosine deaminase